MDKYKEEYKYPQYINKYLIINNLKTISQNIYCKITFINVCYYCILRVSNTGFYVNIFDQYGKIGHLSVHFDQEDNERKSIMHWKDDINNKQYKLKFNVIFNKDVVKNMILSYSEKYNFNFNSTQKKLKYLREDIFNIITNKYNNHYLFYKKKRSNSILSEKNELNNQTNTNTISNINDNLKRVYVYNTQQYYNQYCNYGIKPAICKKRTHSGGEQNSYIVNLHITKINENDKIIYIDNNLKKNNIDKNNIKSLELIITIINAFNESYNEILYEAINKEIENILKINNIKINNNIKESEIISTY